MYCLGGSVGGTQQDVHSTFSGNTTGAAGLAGLSWGLRRIEDSDRQKSQPIIQNDAEPTCAARVSASVPRFLASFCNLQLSR